MIINGAPLPQIYRSQPHPLLALPKPPTRLQHEHGAYLKVLFVLSSLIQRKITNEEAHIICKRTYNITTCACRHKIETPGSLVPDPRCHNCGVEKGKNMNIASSTSHFPCEDCKAKGLWAQAADGKWYEVATGGPQQFTPGFRFPYESSLQYSRFLLE